MPALVDEMTAWYISCQLQQLLAAFSNLGHHGVTLALDLRITLTMYDSHYPQINKHTDAIRKARH